MSKPIAPCTTFVRSMSRGFRGPPQTIKNSICKNAPTVLDNFGGAGNGIGAHSNAHIRNRLRNGCAALPPCANDGTSVIDCQGKLICNPRSLPRKVRDLGQIYTRPSNCP